MCKMFNSKEEYNEYIIKLRLFDKIASYVEQPENWNRLKDCWLSCGRSEEFRNILKDAMGITGVYNG